MAKREPSCGTQSDRDDPWRGPPLPADVMRALDWLRCNPECDVNLEALSVVAGVRPRTLETHFKKFLGVSPLGWVRNSRLARVRQQLINAAPSATVTQIALANGFNQLGRFATTYRKRFGEPPSTTLARRRGAARNSDIIDDEALALTWRAFPAAFAVAPESNAVALDLLGRAQERAPDYGLPKAMAAWCWAQRSAQHFPSNSSDDIGRAVRLLEQALILSPNDALSITLSGGALTLAHRVEEADRLIDRAVALDPSSPIAWLRRGWSSAYLGDSENALCELRSALYLAPLEPVRHIACIGIGCAHFAAGNWERAAAWTEIGVELVPQSFWAERVGIAAVAHYGAKAEARRRGLALLRKDPDLTISVARGAWPFRPAFMDRLCEGLEIAELPRN